MHRHLLVLYGVFLLVILGGAAVGSSHLPTLMTSEVWMYSVRSLLMAGWLYTGYLAGAKSRLIRSSLFVLGGLYVTIGVLALIESTIWGLNQQPLAGVALWLHVAYGAAALIVATRPRRASLGAQIPVPSTGTPAVSEPFGR